MNNTRSYTERKKEVHFKIGQNMGICSSCFTKTTTSIKRITCEECMKLEKHFRGNYKEVFCYSRNDLVRLKIIN